MLNPKISSALKQGIQHLLLHLNMPCNRFYSAYSFIGLEFAA